jgi:hypothetical protein
LDEKEDTMPISKEKIAERQLNIAIDLFLTEDSYYYESAVNDFSFSIY